MLNISPRILTLSPSTLILNISFVEEDCETSNMKLSMMQLMKLISKEFGEDNLFLFVS